MSQMRLVTMATENPAAGEAPGIRGQGQPLPSSLDGRQLNRRRRGRTVALAVVAALICATLGTVLIRPAGGGWDDQSRHGPWLAVFDGYGRTTAAGSGAKQVIELSPGRARSRLDAHAALVLTAGHFGDFVASMRVRTVRQLRRGAAGHPNPWEVGWAVWHYTSNQHFYALTLEPTGWVLSKQDPAYRGGERFLATAKSPTFPVGAIHSVGIVQTGNQIIVSADGHPLAHVTDTQRPYLSGAFGLYAEDSEARFGRIRLNALTALR